jgi:CubicO group peptidase (beta-lactamase class C family)
MIDRRGALALFSSATLLAGAKATRAAANDMAAIDRIVLDFMADLEIPGAAVAVVTPGRAPYLKGYGVRALGRPEPVDIHTQFAIASNSKAFLSACLAMLVDEGKLGWEDPVRQHLPEFQMQDADVTAMMTVRDLLVHRSGLPLGAGDLMQFPSGDHTREELLHALRYFKLARGFRTGYAYDNILYIVAGMLLERVSGKSWDVFVTERIFTPLEMSDAVSNPTLVRRANSAARHGRLGPPTRGFGPLEVIAPDETALVGPAGGINVSVAGIAPWLQVQLARGALPGGGRLWSEARAIDMWTPQTITSSGPGPTPESPERSVISGYALGWGISDYRGRRMIAHAGGLAGQITRTTLLPDQGLAFVIYTNVEDGDAVSALRYALLDRLLDAPAYDWIGAAKAKAAVEKAQVSALLGQGDFTPPPGGPSLVLDRYVGRYRDPWYGDIVVARAGSGLRIDFTRTPVFRSRLEPFGPDGFRTRFPRGAGEDAVVQFKIEGGVVSGVAMRPLSPLADFSFDFTDLNFHPVR